MQSQKERSKTICCEGFFTPFKLKLKDKLEECSLYKKILLKVGF